MYEGMCRSYVISDPLAELALLAIAWMTEDVGLMQTLEANDFHDPGHRFMFSEFRLLIESGEPFGEGVSVARWFGTDAVKKRAKVSIGEVRPKELLAIMLQKYAENFLGHAHKDYYLSVIRRDRLRRAIFQVGLRLLETNIENNSEPWKTVAKLSDWTNQLFEKCYQVFPEKMDQQ
jgi:replicative DNA helicase